MKKTITIYLFLSVIATFILYCNVDAQRLTYGSANDVVTINNSSARVGNLFLIDSIKVDHHAGETRLPVNEVIHQASFEIELGSAEAVNILKIFHSGMQGNQLPSLMLSRTNFQNQVMEERNFSDVTVKEIVFQELNAAEVKEVARAKIIIQAVDVLYNDDPGGKMGTVNVKNSKLPPGNNFRLVMGNLPTERVSRISKLRLISSSRPEYLYFNMDVPSIDAKRWSDWFKTGARTGTNEEAFISLLDQTSANILTLQLSAVEIVSISVSELKNSDRIPITTIGLRTIIPPVIQ